MCKNSFHTFKLYPFSGKPFYVRSVDFNTAFDTTMQLMSSVQSAEWYGTTKLEAENERLRKDAERYGWLIDNAYNILDQRTQKRVEVAVSCYGGGYRTDWRSCCLC